MKILVVDDEKLLVKGMKFNLENEGYEVMTAYDGAAAVELEKKENFDLIVMDVMMPGLSAADRGRPEPGHGAAGGPAGRKDHRPDRKGV